MIHISLDLETWGTAPGCDIRSIGACVFDPMAGWTASDTVNGLNTDARFYIACDNPETQVGDPTHDQSFYDEASDTYRRYPLTRDPATVQWWSEQSDEAQAAFHAVSCSACNGSGRLPNYADLSEDSGFVDCYECSGRGKTGNDPVDLRDCLERFSCWLLSITDTQWLPERGLTTIRLWSHGAHFDPPILAAAYRAVGLPVPWHYRAPRDTRTAFDIAGIDDHSAWLNQHPGPLGIEHHALDDAICQARGVCAAVARVQGWQHALQQIGAYQRGGIVVTGECSGDRDEMIGIARRAERT